MKKYIFHLLGLLLVSFMLQDAMANYTATIRVKNINCGEKNNKPVKMTLTSIKPEKGCTAKTSQLILPGNEQSFRVVMCLNTWPSCEKDFKPSKLDKCFYSVYPGDSESNLLFDVFYNKTSEVECTGGPSNCECELKGPLY